MIIISPLEKLDPLFKTSEGWFVIGLVSFSSSVSREEIKKDVISLQTDEQTYTTGGQKSSLENINFGSGELKIIQILLLSNNYNITMKIRLYHSN